MIRTRLTASRSRHEGELEARHHRGIILFDRAQMIDDRGVTAEHTYMTPLLVCALSSRDDRIAQKKENRISVIIGTVQLIEINMM